MATEIIIPKSLSSVHLVPEGARPHTGTHTVFPERGWHLETYPRPETPARYFQKIETDDLLTIQFDASTSKPMIVDLIGTGFGTLLNATATGVFMVAGNTYRDVSGTVVQLYTHTVVLTPGAVANLAAGIYWLRATFNWDYNGDGTIDATQYAISEPLHIRSRHDNTVLIDCRHDENDEHFIWLGSEERIVSFRIDGRLTEGALSASDTSYEDSLMDAALLSSYPYRSWDLNTDPIPAWLRLKLHHALSCRYFMAERRHLTKGGGSGLEVLEGVSALRKTKATLREEAAANNFVTEFAGLGVIGAGLPVFRKEYGFPYLLFRGNLTVAGTTYGLTSGSVVVENAAAEATIAGQFNIKRMTTSPRLYGRFASVSGSGGTGVYYFPHPLQSAAVTVFGETLNKFFTVGTQQVIGNTSLLIEARCKVMGIQWDTASSAVVVMGASNNATGNYTQIGSFPGALPGARARRFESRIFYRNDAGYEVLELTISGSQTLFVDGRMPNGLQKFSVSGGFMPGFDCDLLSGSLNTLQILHLKNLRLMSLSNYEKPWLALNDIDLTTNSLFSGVVDDIINITAANINAVAYPPANGSLLLYAQSPAAPPTAASVSARQDLTNNYSWTVQTD